MMRVVISQPMYFPWAGFLAQMALADVYIWLDDAQFSKGSFTNRVQVKMPNGRKWMSVSLQGKGGHRKIHDLEAMGDEWVSSHRTLLSQSLQRRPQTDQAMAIFDAATSDSDLLVDCLINSAEGLARHLGVLPPKILRASKMGIDGSSWSRVLQLVRAVGGTDYITGLGARDYLDHEAFEAEGVDVRYMNYQQLPWPQPFGDFTPYITGLDLVASLESEIAQTHLCPDSINWRAFLSGRE